MRLTIACLMLTVMCAGMAAAAVPPATASYMIVPNGPSQAVLDSANILQGEERAYHGTKVRSSDKPIELGTLDRLKFRDSYTIAVSVMLSDNGFSQLVGAAGSGGLVASLDQIKLAIWGSDWVVDQMLPDDEFVLLAVTVDADHTGRMYLNGRQIASAKVKPWPKDPENWTIGGWADATGEPCHGEIKDVKIWNQALTPADMRQLAFGMHLNLAPQILLEDPAPLRQTPASVKAMAKELKGLAIEPKQLPRYPFSAMLGFSRVGQALRLRSYEQRAEAEKWLADEIPTFDCPDPIWKRCYYYRWFVVRANYAEENGIPGFYEGKRGGYTRFITYSAPHIMDEVRWLKDGKYAYGQADILGRRREPDGRRFGGYTHWIASTLWGAYLVHPDKKRLAELLPAWQEDTECAFPGKLDPTRPDADYLLAPPSHWATGMEWQPAWFYFSNYDRTKEAKLCRPDYTAYYYANARAVALALRALGNTKRAAEFDVLADRVKESMERQMWDGDSDASLFYSAELDSGQLAMVKECVGIYPFAFELPDKDKASAFKSILDPKQFWGKWPITTCDMNCPMYDPKVHLCNWNGPVWPHAESIVANALANGVRVYNGSGVTPRKLYEFLDGYTKLQYEDKGTWKKPNVHEEANADDGQMYGCPDYFHSTYNDLIIRLVGGLMPRNDDTVELYPVVGAPWDHFRLDKVPYRGHMLSIVWDNRARGRYAGVPRGYSLYVDGKRIGTKPRLEHVVFKGALK